MKGLLAGRSTGWLVFILMTSGFITLLSAPAFAADEPVARLTAFSGKVLIKSQGAWGAAPEVGLALFSSDRVVTRKGNAVITFHDGAVMELKSNSNLLIEEGEEKEEGLAGKAKVVKRRLRLLLGKLLFKTGAGARKAKTVFETPTAVCGLRGTAGIMSIGADGQAYIQFSEGGAAYTLGDFVSGVAEDVPAELADLNPAQRAAFAAAAAEDAAKTAAEKAATGEISQADADLAQAIAEEAAALEIKTQAEAMLDNPDPAVQAQAQTVIDAAQAAIDAAKNAQQQAIQGGATTTPPETYTEPGGEIVGFSFDVDVPENLEPDIPQEVIDPVGGGTGGGNGGGGGGNGGGGTITVEEGDGGISFSGAFTNFPDTGYNTLFSGDIDEEDAGILLLTGTGALPPQGVSWGGSFNLHDTQASLALGGYIQGIMTNSWDALMTSIYVKDGEAGFFLGNLSGFNDESTFAGAGTAELIHLGPTNVTPGSLAGALANGGSDANEALNDINYPFFESVSLDGRPYIGWVAGDPDFGGANDGEIRGITLTDGRYIGVRKYSVTGGMYRNAIHKSYDGNWGYGGGDYYMLGHLTLTDDGLGHVTISADLDYMDTQYLGTIFEDYTGIDIGDETHDIGEGYGGLPGVGAGNYILQPLTFSGETEGSIVYFDGGSSLQEGGTGTGLLGGTEPTLFSGAPTTVRVMGHNDSYPGTGPYLMYGSGFDFQGDTYITTGDSPDGTFHGYMVGTWHDEEIMAVVRALYIDDEGMAGYLTGGVAGGYITDFGRYWSASGELTAIPVDTTEFTPATLGENLIADHFREDEEHDTTGAGRFATGGGSMDAVVAVGDPIRINNQDWGIWNGAFAGSYTGDTSADWEVDLGGIYEGTDDIWLGRITGNTWGGIDISGTFSAKALTEDYIYRLTGEILGTQSSGTWQAAGIGTYTLEYLDAYGGWGTEVDPPMQPCLYRNDGGVMEDIGHEEAQIGLTLRGDGDFDFLAIGDYTMTGEAGAAYLWNSRIEGEPASGDGVNFEGYTAGIWNKGAYTGGVWADRNMDGAVVALKWTSPADAGFLKSWDTTDGAGGISGKFYEFGVETEGDEDIYYGHFEASGTLSPETMEQQPFFPVPFSGLLYGQITGSFSGGEPDPYTNLIYGTSTDTSETMFFLFGLIPDPTTKPWGIYNLMLGNSEDPGIFTGHPGGVATWSAMVEGSGDFGGFDIDPDWWGDPGEAKGILNGTWSEEGEIRGYLDALLYDDEDTVIGMISGPFFGVNDVMEPPEYGSWIGQSIGTWKWTEGIGEYFGGYSLYHYENGLLVRVGEDPADIGITSLEGGQYHFLALGDYGTEDGEGGPYIQNTRISGSIEDDNGTGAFDGFMAGVWKDQEIEGTVMTIRTTSDGGAGFLTGDVTGGYFPEIGDRWKTKGPLTYVPMAAGLDPAWISIEEQEISLAGSGRFASGGEIAVAVSEGYTASVANQDWGTWRTMQGGTYAGTPSDEWALGLTREVEGAKQWIEAAGSEWSGEKIAAKTAGAWVNWNDAVTGVMGGQLKGTFNPQDATWQAVSAGARMETTRFLNMVANGQTAALQALNIPCIEVGKATLTGQSSLLNVHMKDVTFFSYSTGADPRIWATKDVGGTYSGSPNPGHSVGLSGGGLNADFKVNNWGGNKWGAGVDGSGALKRTDVGGSVNVKFKGAAAGTYGSGNFSGTGAGMASK